MDKSSKRSKTLDTHDGMDDAAEAGESVNNGSARKRANTGNGGGGSQRGKKAVIVENPGVVQARRDQNRIAQREFRMRKQQHIRDLEARVAILSGDRDERQEVMSLLIRNLMNENAQLRKMVKNLAGFIGEGLATCLPRLGLTQESMDAFVNRAETEAAHEAYEALRAVKKKEEQGGGNASAATSNSNNAKKGSYEQLFGPIGSADTPNGSTSGGSKRKASDMGDEDDDEGYEDGEGDEDIMERDFEHDSHPTIASSTTRRDPVSATAAGASTINMSRSPSINFGANGGSNVAAQSSRRGPGTVPSSVRTAPVSTVHGVPLHTLDRLDSPTTAGDAGVGDFSFSPYYNPPSSSAPGDGATPAGLGRSLGNNGDGIPMQYLSSTLHEMRDPLASPETRMHGSQLPPYAYQEQHQQQRAMGRPVPAQQPPYAPQSSTALTMTNGSAAVEPEQGEAARETFDREFERVISTSMGRKQESFQLISYHLNNFHVNPNYVLPLSLRPTQAQRTIPHEHIIDGIIFPTLRDKMIMLRGKYNIFDALRGMWDAFQIMGEDTLDHNSWEVSEQWMKQNLMLVDNEVIAISNRWRLKRGEPAITRESLLASQIKAILT